MGTLEVIPIDTSDDEYMVTNTPDDTTTHEIMPQDVHHTTKEAPPKPLVAEVKKEAPLIKIASYHHPHHPVRHVLQERGWAPTTLWTKMEADKTPARKQVEESKYIVAIPTKKTNNLEPQEAT